MKKTLQTIIHGPWAYWIGAIILAVLNILVLIVRREPWGVTLNIENWGEWIGTTLGMLDDQGFTFKELMAASGTYLNLGLILGAFWATLVASQVRFRPIRDKKFLFSALIGGLLMGYGARIAYGCNVGALLNGIASSSLTGWIFAIAVFFGTWLGSKLLLRYLM
ncbi:MAG TPA: YeeE/YedE thiosulfate transporter family protein [Desulfosporosinus sp.]|nr:YeeE/YedE thiosulfate transporter family protein [Desulfosporosinus sp.]